MTESGRFRAGRYIRQPQGYRAFIPAPLPPGCPPLQLDDATQTLLSTADRALGRLDGSIQTLPAADLFVFMYVRKEAVLSSQIEGTQSSLSDVLAAEAQLLDPGRPQDAAEVLNYVRAMRKGLSRLDALPVSVRLIREIHAELMQGVRGEERQPGELRRSQNWIGPGGCTLAEAVYVPPPPHEMGEALSEWEKFLHRDTRLPLLVKVGLAHAQFETIHPFLDGNGRVGRLLITLLLCEKQVLMKPVLYLSHYFRRHRQRYYDLLQATRDDGAWEAWIRFFLEGVASVADEATATARGIVALREQHRQVIIAQFGRRAANGLQVLESLYTMPIISIQHIINLTGVSFPAASQLMDALVRHGILHEITGQQRHRRFQYSAYIALFSDGPAQVGAPEPNEGRP